MYDNKEHEKFNSPRYSLTSQTSHSRSYLDLQTGIGYCIPWYDPRWSSSSGYVNEQNTERGQYRALSEYMKSRLGIDKYGEENKYNCKDNPNTLLNRTDDIIQLIVGISIGKAGLERLFGAHAFLMYIEDPYRLYGKWLDDVMLDASGSYGKGTFRQGSTNIIYHVFQVTTPATITIDAYRRYWFTRELGEILYTYTYIIDKTIGENIRTLILSRKKRTQMSCALEASRVLDQSRLFPGIKVLLPPVDLKKFLDKFIPQNNEIITLENKSSYDLDVYP